MRNSNDGSLMTQSEANDILNDQPIDFEAENVYLNNLLLSTLFYAPFCPPVMLLGAFGVTAHYCSLKYKTISRSSISEPLQTAIPIQMANNMISLFVALFIGLLLGQFARSSIDREPTLEDKVQIPILLQ